MRFFLLIACLSAICWAHAREQGPWTVEAIPEGGFFAQVVEVALLAPEGVIYYTLDGRDPRSRAAKRYTGPIRLRRTTVVRACVRRGGRWGPIVSHTYFVDEPASTLPVVSLAIEPEVLFHPVYGLFVEGPKAVDTLWRKPGANFWSRKEVPVSVELYETDGRCVYRSLSGMRLFGGLSRLFPQKSIAIVARKRYGARRIAHPVFGKRGPRKFKYLVLRNSGSDWGKAWLRDALTASLVADWDLDHQAERLAIAYINGRYWGLYHLREKVNRYFIASHHEVDKDSIDLLEHRGYLKRGSRMHYLRLLDYLQHHDLSDEQAFAWVATQMDVDNFADYQIVQIFCDNRDAGGNIKYWRPQRPDGRWRWILYDTDWGYGLHDSLAWQFNSLAFHTEAHGPRWPNPPWSTFILRKLLEHEGFRQRFIRRFADRLNTTFRAERVLAKIDSLYRAMLPEMARHLKRWRCSRQQWQREVEVVRTFARNRPAHMWQHLQEHFGLPDPILIRIASSPGGSIRVNGLIEVVAGTPFEGRYFPGIPLQLEAEPALGFRFAGWEGLNTDERILHLTPEALPAGVLHARFEPYQHPLVGRLVFNEVCPYDPDTGDWLELYNATDRTLWLDGWVLTDRTHRLVLPHVGVPAGGYLVLARDSAKVVRRHPYAYNVSDALTFGLNKRRERLGLFAPDGSLVSQTSWDILPMDTAFTLSLTLPWLDASQPDNWELRPGHGTPCGANEYYLETQISSRRRLWAQLGGAAGVLALAVLLLVLRIRGKF